MKYPDLVIFLFCFLFHSHALLSQELDIRTYTTLDGLSDNSIGAFHEDQFGYLWISTGQGLNRFDGINFKKYGMQNGMPAVSSGYIFEDHAGRIWIGSRGGMAEFKNDSFYVYDNTDHIRITYVFQLYENPLGQLIANTLEGQFVFNGTKWEPYKSIPLQNDDIIVTSIETEEGEYFSTGYELFFKPKIGNVKSLWSIPGDFPSFRDLLYFNKELFVVANSQLYKIDTVHKELMFPIELKGKSLLTYYKDSNDRWWFSTRKDGIIMIQERDGHFQVHNLPGPSDFAASYYEDRQKQMWIGSPNGVMKILPSTFSKMKIKEVHEDHHIQNVIPYGDRQLLLSINNGQLLLIQYEIKNTSTYKVISTFSLDDRGDFVDHYSVGENGEMWMTTRWGRLYLFSKNKLENKTHLVTDAGQRLALDVACDLVSGQIVVAMDSILGVGNENKLDTFYDEDHTFIQFPHYVLYIEDLHLVIQSAMGEEFLYGPDENRKKVFSKIPLPSSAYRRIKSDHLDHLWIYSGGENISRYTPNLQSGLIVEEVIDEITDNLNLQFYHFTFDQNGSIWCVTNQGIRQIYKDEKNLWQSREHVIYEISHTAYADWYKIEESGDQIWVNLRNQLIYFDRNIPEVPVKSGVVILEEVLLNNQTTSWKNYTDSLSGYFQTPVDLHLKYHQNTLTFVYNNPNTLESRGTTYSYRLLPGVGIWSYPSENKSISFSNLKPEQYTFQVRSRNMGGDWSNSTLFSFSIQKPYWDTTWFRILILLLVSGLVAWVFRIRLRQERSKGEMKSQLLELEMRALRAQMNPHFIYNALNSIQSLVATNQTASANKYISKFARLLRQVLENSKRSEIPLSKELESLRLYVDLEKLRLDEEVIFIEKVEETIAPETILIPPLVLQPFVENALWHGLSTKEGEKRIELTITADHGWLRFVIADNGIGRQKAAMLKSPLMQHESTAMQVTEQRLRDFNRTLNSDPLQIEDVFLPDGSTAGTRILLHVKKKSTFTPTA